MMPAQMRNHVQPGWHEVLIRTRQTPVCMRSKSEAEQIRRCSTKQDKAEAKLASMETRAEEQRKAKAKADKEWRQQQRERELKRAEEERAREKEVRLLCMTS